MLALVYPDTIGAVFEIFEYLKGLLKWLGCT